MLKFHVFRLQTPGSRKVVAYTSLSNSHRAILMKKDVVTPSNSSVFESVENLVVEMLLNNLINEFMSTNVTTKLEQKND